MSYPDNGEPEDNRFYRDYKWVQPELERAYDAGKADAAAEIAWLRAALARIARWDESGTGYQGPGAETEMKLIALAHMGMYTIPKSADADETHEEF